MGPALEMEGKSRIMMEISSTKSNDSSVHQHHEDTLVPCASNIEDNTFHLGALFDGAAKAQNGCEDVEVNITDSTKSAADLVLVEAECKDTTENSSSFGDTISGTDNGFAMGDVEVDSPICGGNGLASVFDGALPMRKKKLTDQWRRFIHPIMWRCKWVELRIKEFQSQALKYDRELAKYDQRKHFEYEKSTSDDYYAKSRPFSCQNGRNQVMKRKQRKRVEETMDLASYMSSHNLFSYYEYKRSVADGAFVDDAGGNLADNKMVNHNDNFEFENGFLELREGENYLEQILQKIELAQSEVRKLRTRIDKVMSENPGKFTSVNRLSLLAPCDVVTDSDRAISTPKNANGIPDRSVCRSSQHLSECNMEDLFMPKSAVSSHGVVTPFPDMIESIGCLPQVGVSCENIGEAILMQDQTSEEVLHNFERVISKFTEKPQVSTSKLEALPPVMAPEADLPVEMSVPDGQPSSSGSNVRNNKRKGGRQKSRMGKWSRRSSG